ncbi:uncharacterized protein KLLA0_D00374g [Kluyveromyces lactis]|uniref:KLLA0D00374p n=1 Tax=Kluyveromyces lactis (strain ATCC 8585 / CBS 2359 / DSM 70799 / NBRC 1267 / NRRL Y-1140 / WM37) TaxID=284590 RepID=Q6CSK1_KLULA|nr:uncharacterized protein KLLA0_D00374g [Kluyveromyces lactis]CAH00184.1 KLLA0D00374p [Kluyveromyces lactis]|eukprot:XP_453088.1 uncharacterized protein KLLA0_D00374g [Kluyveromyces lactis]
MSSDSVSENAKYEVADSCSADKINADDRHHMIMSDVLPDLGKPFYKVPYLRTLSLFVVGLSLSSTNLGYDGSLLNGLYAMPDYLNAMGNPNGAELGVISNGMVFGMLILFQLAPYIIDKYGRKVGMYVGNVLICIGVLIQALSGTWINGLPEDYDKKDVFGMFVASRIILGSGVLLISIATPALISEISYPPHRELCTSIYNTCWYLGAIVSAWVTYGCRNLAHHWNWRIPSIIQALFPLVQLVALYKCPESPRYLVFHNRDAEARAILNKYHAGNNEEYAGLIDFELAEIKLAIEQEKASQSTKFSDFIKTSGNRHRLWILIWTAIFTQLSGNGLVSYYLSKVFNSIGITDPDDQLKWNGWLMLYNWLCSLILIGYIAPFFKRRQLFLISLVSMTSCYVVWTALSAENQKRNFEDKSLANGVLAMIFLYYLSYNFGFNGFPNLYTTEILPYTLRGKGLTIFQLAISISVIFNGFVNPVAMDAIEWKYYIFYCCFLAVEIVVCYFTFVETSGRSLEEVDEVFGDGITQLPEVTSQIMLEAGKRLSVEHVERTDTSS